MTALGRLLLTAWLRGFLLVQLGGIGLLAIVVATEAADEPVAEVRRRLVSQLPYTWALLSPALALAAAALTAARLSRSGQLLALGTLGVSPRRVRTSVLWVATPFGLVAMAVGHGSQPRVDVARVTEAWIVQGAVLPDPGASVSAPAALLTASWGSPTDWPGTAVLLILASLTGASLGSPRSGWAVLVAAAGWVVVDALRRGSEPLPGAGIVLVAGLVAVVSARRPAAW
ncbi:MAG: LptF/LptG family permease [Myxococcales bacterium]|nr:LptF/LptG family permease [Myxococcales bacterium]